MQEQNEVVEEKEVDYKAIAVELEQKAKDFESRLNAVDAKNQELLKEKRDAKEAAKKAEAEKASKDGDWQKQLELMKQDYDRLEGEYKNTLSTIKEEKVKNVAFGLANDIASNPANAKILSTLMELELKAMSDEKGQIGDDVVKALRAKYKNDDTYSSLVAGSKAVGAGAPGSSTSGKAEKTITRSEIDALSPQERVSKLNDGYKVVQ
jgi:DNA repair exonuclease SbcCD ATPase subunit